MEIAAARRPPGGAAGESRDVLEVIRSFLRRIDDGLSRQLDAVLHHPEFQRLEATWRGLHYLVLQSETGSMRGRTATIPFVDPRKERPAQALQWAAG
jgi:predicted component of type VI protein secretion system